MRREYQRRAGRIKVEKGLHLVLLKMAGTKLRPANYRPGLYTFRLRVTAPAGGKPEGITVWN